MNDFYSCESVLRNVLKRELRLTDLRYQDDLIRLDPDFPTDEVVKDVFEAFGYRGQEPTFTNWSGTFGDLVSMIDLELERIKRIATEE